MPTELAGLANEVARAAGEPGPPARVIAIDPMLGGHSGLTHRVSLEVGGRSVAAVVKSAPPGRPVVGRHDVLRQARILRVLEQHGGVAAPRVLFAAQDPIPLFGMTLALGFAAEPTVESARVDETPAGVRGAWRAAIDVLTALQRIEVTGEELEREPVTSLSAELERWNATARAGGLETDDPRAARLAARLAERMPAPEPPCIVHGDFRLGNMLQQDGVITALVDWEIWSIGDPRLDLGWLALFVDPGHWPSLGRAAPGTPTARQVIDRYLGASHGTETGRAIGWFRALACFKLAAIQAHNLRRHREGRYHDPHQERVASGTGAMLAHGLDLLAD